MPSSENSGNCRAMGSIRWTNGMLTSPRAQSCASLGPQVQALDRRREAHRTVDVTLGHVDFQALDHQVGADQDDESQRQHLHRRIVVDEATQRLRRKQRSEEQTSELQSLMRITYAVFC